MNLTPRQLQIVKGIAMGKTVKEIALRIGISSKTVEYHFGKVCSLLRIGGVRNVNLTRWAIRAGVVSACLAALLAFGGVATGPTQVTLAWNPQSGVDTFYLYTSTNAALPLNQWTPLTNAPGTATNLVVIMTPGQQFFFLTASNLWGESGPSNTANTPPVPTGQTNLVIHR